MRIRTCISNRRKLRLWDAEWPSYVTQSATHRADALTDLPDSEACSKIHPKRSWLNMWCSRYCLICQRTTVFLKGSVSILRDFIIFRESQGCKMNQVCSSCHVRGPWTACVGETERRHRETVESPLSRTNSWRREAVLFILVSAMPGGSPIILHLWNAVLQLQQWMKCGFQ